MRIPKYLMIFVIITFSNITWAGQNNYNNQGLGIELGLGHNCLIWPSTIGILTPGAGAVDRKELFITPNLRLNYTFDLSNKFDLLPFIDYNSLAANWRILVIPLESSKSVFFPNINIQGYLLALVLK